MHEQPLQFQLVVKDAQGTTRVNHQLYTKLYQEAMRLGQCHVEVLVKQLRDQMEAA